MKNFFRSLVAVAVLFGAASCTTEDLSTSVVGGGESVELTITANLAQIGTRTLGDGTQVNRVYLGVYENGDGFLDELTKNEGYAVDAGKATIPVVLLKNKKYDLVFWAQNDAVGKTCYTVDWTKRELSVDYTNVKSQVEARDAFFLVQNGFEAGKDETTFKLNRPFAQLNAGLSEVEVTNVTNNGVVVADIQSKVTVEVAKTMDLAQPTGVVSDFAPVTFEFATKPTESLSAANGTYNWLSMNYLLVDEYKLVNVAYEFLEGGTTYKRNYASVPVQRNYRTNIIGALLSSTINFNVEIVPGFVNDDHNIVVAPVKTAAELKAAVTNGITEITLGADIELNETLEFKNNVRSTDTTVNYTIDLNGKTLKYTGDDRLVKVTGVTLNINGNGTIEVDSDNLDVATTAAYIGTAYEGGKIVVNGGKHITNGCTLYHANGGTVEINGGEFDANETGYATAGKYGYKYTLNIQGDNGAFVVRGGTFYNYNPAKSEGENPVANFVAEGYVSLKSADNAWTVVPVVNNTVEVSTATALKSALSTTTPYNVTLANDIVSSTPFALTAGQVVVNLNGKTLETVGAEVDAFVLTGDADLTINGEGNIIATMDCVFAKENSKVTINGGNLYATCEAVYAKDNATAVINNGTFKVEGEWNQTYTLNLKDESNATITVNGGSYYKFDPAFSTSENPKANFVATGYKSVQDGDWYVVVPESVDSVVSTSAAATTALTAGKSVVLSQDVEATATIKMSNTEAVLDGNGNSIYGELNDYSTPAINTAGGTIKNLSVVTGCKYSIACPDSGLSADLILENVTTDKTGYGVNMRGDSGKGYKLIAKNCTFKGWSSMAAPAEFDSCYFGQGEYWVNRGNADVFDRIVKPYKDVVFENCEFEYNFYLDLSAFVGTTVKLVNCTVNGVALTKDMFKNYSTSTSGNQLVSELDGKTALWYEATDAVWATVVVE